MQIRYNSELTKIGEIRKKYMSVAWILVCLNNKTQCQVLGDESWEIREAEQSAHLLNGGLSKALL